MRRIQLQESPVVDRVNEPANEPMREYFPPTSLDLCTTNFRGKYWVRRAGVLLLACLLLAAVPAGGYQTPLDVTAVHDAFVLGQRNDQSTGDFLAPYIKEMNESRSDLHVAEIEILTPFAQVVDDSRKNTAGYTEQQAAQKYQQVGNTILVNVTLMLPAVYPQAANNNGKDTSKDAGASDNKQNSMAASDSAAGNPPSGSATSSDPAVSKPTPGNTEKAETAKAEKAADTAQAKSDLRPENFWQSFQFYFKQNGKNVPSKALHDKAIYSTATKDKPAVLDGAAVWIEFDAKDVASQDTVIEVTTPDGKTISATFDLKKLR